MPKIFSTDFDQKLRRLPSNIAETEAFLLEQPTPLELPDFVVQHGYRLLQSKVRGTQEGAERTICLIADTATHSETVYKVKVLVRETPNAYLHVTNATQLLVWRTAAPKHELALNGFASKVFAYLLQTHNIMVTDKDQTPDGRRFWERRILEAVAMESRHVYYIDLNELDDAMVPVITEITDSENFYEHYEPIAWGSDDAHGDRVFVISCQNLKPE
ncbi:MULTISPECIES: hypothetical protein [Shewanella]|jgi:hypothetical protein|uniref:hypothetical protein n=1 Tax=Shewanella TaxID=22 RepID=UPI000849C2A3|nr:hypothetical protein [Shewanella xiamenensis]MBW0298890.1 hypothetical protein [Shewanella xiamenensis]MCT8865753.1 hypothetical protein [Shewanella xiamenensis]MCT8869047.1 hypothetical protein [Shewanella xiamenensis]MCT8874393.1 hypothetical protein [Shewanella xiamenensis]MCT8878299.1 hypothetical protein [Shewanella xiamenensis]